jgi:hypothetical protein
MNQVFRIPSFSWLALPFRAYCLGTASFIHQNPVYRARSEGSTSRTVEAYHILRYSSTLIQTVNKMTCKGSKEHKDTLLYHEKANSPVVLPNSQMKHHIKFSLVSQ